MPLAARPGAHAHAESPWRVKLSERPLSYTMRTGVAFDETAPLFGRVHHGDAQWRHLADRPRADAKSAATVRSALCEKIMQMDAYPPKPPPRKPWGFEVFAP